MGGRRNSRQAVPGRIKPTRTDSGREFWGLPEAPRRRHTLLSQEILEDDSDEEQEGDEEWVRRIFQPSFECR